MQTVAMKAISLPELPPKPSKDVAAKLFPGFVQTEVCTSGATIHVFHKGDGPPVLLLHGYPESHVTWHKVAPRLAERFSVYVPDLRGYGDSSRPTDGDRHVNYSFRAMALSDEQPRNTKRGADCHLTLPDRSTGEQKVDDVEAGNQQNETDATSTRSSFCTRPVT